MPRFPGFEEAGLLLARRLTPLRFDARRQDASRSRSSTAASPSQVDLVLVDVPGLFDRAGVYGERGEDYPDNAMRFAVLSRAAAELAKQRAPPARRSTSFTSTTGRPRSSRST